MQTEIYYRKPIKLKELQRVELPNIIVHVGDVLKCNSLISEYKVKYFCIMYNFELYMYCETQNNNLFLSMSDISKFNLVIKSK